MIEKMSANSDDPPPPPSPSHSLSRNLSLSRLNAEAPEFVPRPTQPPPPPNLFHQPPQLYGVRMPVHRGYPHQIPVHHFQYQQQQQEQHHKLLAEQQQLQLGQRKTDIADSSSSNNNDDDDDNNNNNNNNNNHQVFNKNGLTDEAAQKIINQVEYYFSDVNLATTDHLMRFISKDPDGYVPLSVVSSFKKIKALISSNSQLASILRNSEKLAVSDDGKRVKRLLPLTDADMEDLQSRIVVAENLPEDHCHQNLMKVFSAVGSVNSIRTCLPVTSGGGSSSGSRTAKADGMHYSNKLHAFVEYESVELAEKAVTELNKEDNWRNGLRVHLLHKCTKKSGQVRVKKENEGETHYKEDETSTSEQPNEKHLEDSSQQYESQSNQGEEYANEKDGKRKGRSRARGKGCGKPQFQQNQNQNYNHNNHHSYRNQYHHGNHVGATPVNPINPEHPTVFKQPPGPRMPDGTRGFSMGRGKPVSVNNG